MRYILTFKAPNQDRSIGSIVWEEEHTVEFFAPNDNAARGRAMDITQKFGIEDPYNGGWTYPNDIKLVRREDHDIGYSTRISKNPKVA